MTNLRTPSTIVIGILIFLAASTCSSLRRVDVWIESRRGIHSHELEHYFSGPFIYRKTDHPGFVYQRSTCRPLDIKDLFPFLLIIDCPDSMSALTDFDILPMSMFEVLTSGRIRFSTGHVVEMSYILEVDGWEKGNEFKETIDFLFHEKEIEFEINKGRVFRLFTEVDDNGDTTISLEQLDLKLPATRDILALEAGTRSDSQEYDLWFDWWQQNRSSKKR